MQWLGRPAFNKATVPLFGQPKTVLLLRQREQNDVIARPGQCLLTPGPADQIQRTLEGSPRRMKVWRAALAQRICESLRKRKGGVEVGRRHLGLHLSSEPNNIRTIVLGKLWLARLQLD